MVDRFSYGALEYFEENNYISYIFKTVDTLDRKLHLSRSLCYLSHIMRKLATCIFENKDADQLHSNFHVADQRLCFCYIKSTIPPLSPIFQAPYHLRIQWLYSPDCVRTVQKPLRQFILWHGGGVNKVLFFSGVQLTEEWWCVFRLYVWRWHIIWTQSFTATGRDREGRCRYLFLHK